MSRALSVVATVSVFAASVGVGYTFQPSRGRWPGSTAEFRLSEASFPSGSAQNLVVRDAFEAWNGVDGCEFLFTYFESGNSSANNHSDRVNGVGFSRQIQRSVLGVTFSNDGRNQRFAADVLFNSQLAWNFSGSPSRREFQFANTAKHEFGHALGLNHSDRGCRALMGGGCGSPGVIRDFARDDLEGARFLYPGPSRSSGSSGSPGGTSSPQVDWRMLSVTANPSRARPGERVTVSYVVENAGGAFQGDAPARTYLLSANQTITTRDTALLTTPERQGPFDAGARFQGSSEVTIPSGATPGAYFLGVFVDASERSAESSEDNNTAFAPIEILSATAQPPASSPAPSGSAGPSGSTGTGPQVDWQVSQLTVNPLRVRNGDTLSLSYTVTNGGRADAQALPEVQVLLSTNDTISAQDTVIETVAARAGSFAPGSGDSQTFSFQVGQLQPGTYYMGVFVDPRDGAAESVEDNNTAAASFEVLDPSGQTGTGSAAPPASTGGASGPVFPGAGQAAGGTTTSGATASGPTPAAAAQREHRSGGGCSLAPGVAPSDAGAGLALLALLLGLGGIRGRLSASA